MLLVATMVLYKVMDVGAGFALALLLKPVVVAAVALLLPTEYAMGPVRAN